MHSALWPDKTLPSPSSNPPLARPGPGRCWTASSAWNTEGMASMLNPNRGFILYLTRATRGTHPFSRESALEELAREPQLNPKCPAFKIPIADSAEAQEQFTLIPRTAKRMTNDDDK